jgi:replicative DNA helicase
MAYYNDDDNKLLRVARDNEELFVAASFINPEVAKEEAGWLSPEDFRDKRYGDYWKAVLETGDAAKSANDIGIMVEVFGLTSRLPFSVEYREYARKIQECAFLRRTMYDIQKLATSIHNVNIEDVHDIVDRIHARGELKGQDMPMGVGELEEKFLETIETPKTIVKTNIATLDMQIGMYAGELILFAARPGVGKTAFWLCVARSVAFSGRRVLFVTLEMREEQLWARMACGNAGYDWQSIQTWAYNAYHKTGDVNREALEKVKAESKILRDRLDGRLFIDGNAATVQDIQSKTIAVKPDLLIVDQLPNITWHDPSESQVVWYGKACQYLIQHIAKPMEIPVVLIHQLKREVEYRDEKRPVMSDLKWSGDIEQKADQVWFGHRDDYYERESSAEIVPFEISIKKNRQGKTNFSVGLAYDLKRQWFS